MEKAAIEEQMIKEKNKYRLNLLSIAKGKRIFVGLWISWVFISIFLMYVLIDLYRNERIDSETRIFLACLVLILSSSFSAGLAHEILKRRFNALIELIGEAKLLEGEKKE